MQKTNDAPREPTNKELAKDGLQQAERAVLAKYGPNGMLVRDDMEIVQFYGHGGGFVAPVSGKASLNLLKMVRQEVAFELRGMVQVAKAENRAVRRSGLNFQVDGHLRRADVEVFPLQAAPDADKFYFILLKDGQSTDGRVTDGEVMDGQPAKGVEEQIAPSTAESSDAQEQLLRLQTELSTAKEYLQSFIEVQEGTNEELKSANEEILSSNEELQSTNEELETAKEELQSTNEELTTLNDELQSRNRQLGQANDDLMNLLSSVNIPIVMLNHDLQIRHFTPMAERVLNLIPSDVGRPLSHINFNINVPNMEQLVTDVMQTVVIKERTVRDRQGHWYSLRIRPYLTRENKIDGAVIVLLDVTEIKQIQQRALQSERLAAIGQTMATVAHESRNMLQHLQSGFDLLQDMLQGQPEPEQIVEGLIAQQLKLHRLFDDVQRYAAPIHLERRFSRLSEIWHDAIEAITSLTKDRNVRISQWPGGLDDHCSLDTFRVQQVFRNLLENSLAACTDPVVVQLSCRETDLHGEPAICLSIRDNGPGLTPEQRERIFDAFYTTKSDGTGLGMAICKRVVDAHGGLIQIGTFAEHGTEILITLPCQPLD